VRSLLFSLAAALAGAGALAVTASGTSTACKPTVGDTPGPFSLSPLDAPLRAKIGTGHVLHGRVVRATDCRPVSRALVIFWQAGRNGYGPAGRGSVYTNRLGRFRFEGPVPASYSGRAPHIHIAVIHPAYEELLSRYVVRRGAKSGRIRLVLTPLL
jgi:protocatechuate 3,4-dioxygenase beta subunit